MKARYSAVLLASLLFPILLFARVEGKFDRTLNVSGPVDLDLTTGSGDVLVRAGSGDRVVIHGIVHSSNDWFGGSAESAVHAVENNPPIEQNGNTIRIGYNLPEDARRHVSISYEVTVPPDTELKGNTGSGSFGAEGLRRAAKIHTGSGDIRARDLGPDSRLETGSGSIRARELATPFYGHTGSGDIEATVSGSAAVELQTGSGSLHVSGVKGGLHARTGSGDVNVEGDPKGNWNLHTGSGTVRMALGSSGGFNLSAHTGSGSIHSDLPITMQGTLNRHELKGAVRGGGPEVEVSTGSGDIDIR